MNIFKKLLVIIPFALSIGAMPVQALTIALPSVQSTNEKPSEQLLAQHTMSLADRYAVPSVNKVFADNIILTLAYMSGTVKNPSQINWDSLHTPASYTITLQHGEVFAFHDAILPEFSGKQTITTNAHFDGSEGFVSDGYLYGDGVCHFASLINWVAQDAGLKVIAPTPHNFAKIPDIDPKYGTAIYAGDPRQNLYVENTLDKPVKMVFTYKDDSMTVSIYK